MGKFGSPQIGAFSPDGNNYDDPNLNKCPNCGALFDGTKCPICKTVCEDRRKKQCDPAQMPVAKPKTKKPVALIVCLVISILLNLITARVFDIKYSNQSSEIDKLQEQLKTSQENLKSAEHDANALRQLLTGAQKENEALKKAQKIF